MGARSSKNTTQNNRSDGHLLEYFRNTFVRGGGALPLLLLVSQQLVVSLVIILMDQQFIEHTYLHHRVLLQ
jgi:hypothetical protein